jgi:GTP-binding protein
VTGSAEYVHNLRLPGMLYGKIVRSTVARTSASPGKTRQVNVYRITPAGGSPVHLMDLPGYGHAGGGVQAQREFAAMTALYFGTRTTPGQITPGVIFDAGRAGHHSGSDVRGLTRQSVA